MAGETMPLRNPAGHRGLLSSLLATVNALVVFFETRLGLVGQEAKSALVHILILVACFGVAAFLCAVGFIFLVAGLIAGLAHALHVSWIWVALVVALIDFGVALIFIFVARSRISKPMFQASLEELRKDREWLKNLDRTTLSPK